MPDSATTASTRCSGRSSKPTRSTERAACGAFLFAGEGVDYAVIDPDGLHRGKAQPYVALPVLAAAGALMAASGVALAAYAAHAGVPALQTRLYTAAAFAFGHGAALASLALHAPRWATRLALRGLGVGTVLFAGSLACAALLQTSTALAPAGGMVLIASWLLMAVDRLRG